VAGKYIPYIAYLHYYVKALDEDHS